MKRVDTLESSLKDVQAASGVIEPTAVVPSDGLFMTGSLRANIEKDRFSAKSTLMFPSASVRPPSRVKVYLKRS